MDPVSNPNYDCSAIENSECTNGEGDGICICKSGFAQYQLVNDEYEEIIRNIFDNSFTDIICAYILPWSTGLGWEPKDWGNCGYSINRNFPIFCQFVYLIVELQRIYVRENSCTWEKNMSWNFFFYLIFLL